MLGLGTLTGASNWLGILADEYIVGRAVIAPAHKGANSLVAAPDGATFAGSVSA